MEEIMKKIKIMAAICLLAILSTSCSYLADSDTTVTEDFRKNRDEKESTTEVEGSIESSESLPEEEEDGYISLYGRAEHNIEESVIYDARNVKITAKELTEKDKQGNIGLALWIENNTTQDLIFFPEDLYVNKLNSLFLGSTAEIKVSVDDAKMLLIPINSYELEHFGINDIKDIDIAISGINENGSQVILTDLVNLETDLEGELQEADPSAVSNLQMILNDKEFEIYGGIFNGQSGKYLEIFVKNKKDKTVKISSSTLIFNDSENLEDSISNSVPGGMSWDLIYNLEDPVVRSVLSDGEEIKTITLAFGFRESNTSAYDRTTDAITINVE